MQLGKQYNTYFFDFYGTIMHRKCSGDDIKKIWSNQLALQFGNKLNSKAWYKLRKAAEQYVCKKENHFEFTYRDLVTEIYDRLSSIEAFNINSIDLEQFYELCLRTEIDIEIEMQVKNNHIIDIIKQLKACGKQVYILSDFYLESKYLMKFLEAKGENKLVERIFVSCEYLKNKADGSIYKEILEVLECAPESCCMIGDNYRSDCVNARRNGIAAVKIKDDKNFNKDVNCCKVLNKLECHEHNNGMSYANYSFMFFKFISSLYCELLNHADKKVFFFSREGELLKVLFDNYCCYIHKKFDLPVIESDYLYISRQAVYPASLKDLREENFESLFRQYSQLSIKTFLINIGFSEKDQETIKKQYPRDYDKVIDDFEKSDVFSDLKGNVLFSEIYNKTILEKRNLLKEYLRQHSFFDTRSVAVVDVGWKGSIQDYIVQCIEGEITVRGYYCGINNNAKSSLNNQKKGIIFSEYPYKTSNFTIWSYDANFMERLLTASHASTRGYKNVNGIIEPVLNEFGSEEINYRLIEPVQKALIAQFNECVRIILNQPILSDELENILALMHIKCCCQVYKSNLVLQQRLLEGQIENFGYQIRSGKRLKKAFSLKSAAMKIGRNYKLLKKIPLVIRFMNIRKLYFVSLCLMRLEKRRLRKEYYRCKIT